MSGIHADQRLHVVALADANQDAADKFKMDHGLDSTIYTNYQELLEQERPDIVVASLWTPLHLPVFRDCIGAGVKAVLSEKPMSATWGDCLEMAQLAEQTGCQLTFCHQRRFAEGNLLVRRMIAEGLFGEIKRLDLYSPPNLLDCGTHTIDQALSFLNETTARWVLGAVDTSEVFNWFDVRAECMATGTIVFQDGVRATLQTGGPDMDIWGGVRVTGTKGFIEVFWDGKFGQAAVYNQPDWKPPVVQDSDESHMAGVVRNAVDCLESGEEPETSYQKALRASEIIFALYESVRRRARVELPLTEVLDNPLHSLLDADSA
jgi:predicted dehydrogenase